MPAYKNKHFPRRVLERYAELILRHVYQAGGRDRYVPITEVEDALGIESYVVFNLCRFDLVGELHIAFRPPVELEEDSSYCSAIERQVIRDYFARPHVRIRPEAVRRTEEELVAGRAREKRKKKRKKRRKSRT